MKHDTHTKKLIEFFEKKLEKINIQAKHIEKILEILKNEA